MCKRLMSNSQEKGIVNIEIVNKKWEEIDVAVYEKRFDIIGKT